MPKSKRKKQGHHRKPRKQRDEWVKLQAKGGPDGVLFHFDKETGGVFSPQAIPGTVTTYQSYRKSNGSEKIIYQVSGRGRSANLSLRHELSTHFDVIAGIDTNTYEIDGRLLSIAFSFASAPILKQNFDSLRIEPTPAFIFENVHEGINPEVIAWYHFFASTLPLISGNGRYDVAMVVDSELGRHPEINARTTPYYREFILPDRVQLIYASSDTGTDLPNKLIKQCDHGSRTLADQIRCKSFNLPPILGSGWKDYDGAARINFKNAPFLT